MWVLDVNDAEIALARDRDIVYREPGIAHVDDREVTFGHVALEQSRVRPRQAHSQFWQRMNAEPLNSGGREAQNQADLVYLHLCAIRDAAGVQPNDPVRIAVPSVVTNEQLSILLGIAQEANISVRALVDASVAAASTEPLPRSCKYLDISLHRAIVTTLEVDDIVRRDHVAEVPEAGLAMLVEGWVDAIADRFVAETRFDPLRIADTEQQVFNQIFANLSNGAQEISIDLAHQNEVRHIAISSAELAGKSEQRYDVLARQVGEPTTVVVTHRVVNLPGLVQRLESRGHRVIALRPDAALKAIRDQIETLVTDDGSVPFVTQMASSGQIAASVAAVHNLPTHLLCGSVAVPLGGAMEASEHPECLGLSASFRVTRVDEGYRLHPDAQANVSINGRSVSSPAAVESGDIVRSGAIEFRLITVAPSG